MVPCGLNVTADLAGLAPSGCAVSARLLEEGAPVRQPVASLAATLTLTVPQPKLWWPNGLGQQNLYTVEVQLLDASGTVLDTMRKRIGLRQFETVPKTKEAAYTLKVNGQPFFAKGADMIPPDNLLARITPEVLRGYVQDAAACNFNFIRLWGGGFYEDDALFDACDELGIALMFEFKFANTSFPSFDEKFIANVKPELEDQILRVRHHPSIAIWSGNNEIRGYVGYAELFDQVIGGAVRQLAPGQPYQQSPAAGPQPRTTTTGGLGHGSNPFSRLRPNSWLRRGVRSPILSRAGLHADVRHRYRPGRRGWLADPPLPRTLCARRNPEAGAPLLRENSGQTR